MSCTTGDGRLDIYIGMWDHCDQYGKKSVDACKKQGYYCGHYMPSQRKACEKNSKDAGKNLLLLADGNTLHRTPETASEGEWVACTYACLRASHNFVNDQSMMFNVNIRL